jgi:lipopolysaccharide export system permease protein
MATLTRYIIADLLKVLLLWLGIFTMLFVFSLLGVEFRRGGVSAAIIMKIVPYIIPQALVYAIPATTLLAVCVVYGRISSSNEVVALKSLGISPWAITWPAMAMAFLMSLICVQLNEISFSWGELGVRRVIIQSVEDIVYGMLQSQRTYSTERISISVRDVQDRRLIQPVIIFHGHDSGSEITISADEAELRSNLENNTLKLILTNSVIESGGSLQGEFPGRTEREIPLSFASTKGDLELSATHRTLREIPAAAAEQEVRIRNLKQALAADLAMNLLTGELHELNEPRWQTLRQELRSANNDLHRLRAEPWRRSASGFMCLCFAVVGIPLSIQRRNNDFMTTFAICFLPILFCYFPLFFTCFNYAKIGTIPPATIWLANLICFFIGWRLWQVVDRY